MAPPGTELAELADTACPIFRPDVDGVAYWEFEVGLEGEAGPTVLATSAARGRPELVNGLREPSAREPGGDAGVAGARGFIMVSTGEHDFPIPHWSLQRPPISRQLEAEAGEAAATIARIYKLDALAYIAENEVGEEVARSGQTPAPIEGLGHDLGRRAGEISSFTAKPERADDDDNKARDVKHSVSSSGPKPPDLQARDPERWPELKERYADAFGPFLDTLRRRAEGPWKIDRLVAEFGEGVMAGEPRAVGLLHHEAAVEVTGEGSGLVSVDLDEKPGRKPRMRVRAQPSPRRRETDFQVRIKYGNGEEETLRYFIVSRDIPSNVRAEGRLRGELE